jgi:hypothetical protein
MANAYLVGIYNKVILSGDLGVHIGVYQPQPITPIPSVRTIAPQ